MRWPVQVERLPPPAISNEPMFLGPWGPAPEVFVLVWGRLYISMWLPWWLARWWPT